MTRKLGDEKMTIKTELMLVTKEKSLELLAKNTTNRKLREKIVAHYARLIEAGKWVVTHQGLAISENGSLLDGQHRLAAIAKTGIAVEMMITTGLPDSIFSALDSGLTRTITDRTGLTTFQAENASLIAYIAGLSTSHKISPDITMFIHNKIAKYESEVEKVGNKKTPVFQTSAFRAAAIIHLMNGDDKVLTTYEHLMRSDIESDRRIVRVLLKSMVKGRIFKGNKVHSRQIYPRAMYILAKQNINNSSLRFNDDYWKEQAALILKANGISFGYSPKD